MAQNRIPHDTGHDIHFLSRTGRVAMEQAEIALALYRSPDLVQEILADKTLPPRSPGRRVAVAIAAGPEPPHVVVADDGGFVTCLGAGMSPEDRPVLPFERLRYIIRRTARTRHQLEAATDLLGDRQACKTLLERMFTAGNALSREEFQQLSVMTPLLGVHLVVHFAKTITNMHPVAARLKGARAARGPDLARAQFFLGQYHTVGHMALLCGQSVRTLAEVLNEHLDVRWNLYAGCYAPLLSLGYWPVALRVLWAVARLGKPAIPWLRRDLSEAPDDVTWFLLGVAMLGLGTGHRKLRAEVAGHLSSAKPPENTEFSRGLRRLLRELAEQVLRNDRPEVAEAEEERASRDDGAGEEGFATLLRVMKVEVPPAGLDAPLPPAVQACLLLNRQVAVQDNAAHLAELAGMCPLVVLMPAEAFYLPAAYARLRAPFDGELALRLARPLSPVAPMVRGEPRVGRNDACPCGSGEKYKRCCARKAQ